MTEPHVSDPIEENLDSHPLRVAIGVLIGAFAVIVGIILLAQFAIDSYGSRPRKNDASMRPERVAQRIAPDAKLDVNPNAPVAAAPAAAAAAAPSAATPASASSAPTTLAQAAPAGGKAEAGGAGKATFDKVCTACHSTGALGAPKFGDKAAWGPRIAQGKEALYNSALHGKAAMPAKGGNPSLSDADVKAAVDYMVSATK